MAISLSGKNGFTLVEVMVAMLIMFVGLMGLLEALSVATEQNLKNQLRDEAGTIAQSSMQEIRVKAFDNISVPYAITNVPSNIRGFSKNYTMTRSTRRASSDATTGEAISREIVVQLDWDYKGKKYHHEARSMRSR